MTRPPEPRFITFDTNLVGVWNTRAFWATLCETVDQRMVLMPTTQREVLRRIRLETEREWTEKLEGINRTEPHHWSKVTIRRLATTAATASRDYFRDTLGQQGAIYATVPEMTEAVEELEAEIESTIPDNGFDLSTGNGIRDRKIVIEAMARGYDILASNNIRSIRDPILDDWLRNREGKELGIQTTILRPEAAEQTLRSHYRQSVQWLPIAAARACVTDPSNPHRAAHEIAELINPFPIRGMLGIKDTIYQLTHDEKDLKRVLDHVLRHGTSQAMRNEREMQRAATRAVSRRAQVSINM